MDHRAPNEALPSLDGPIITVKVGEEERVYQVHENLLKSRSMFFAKALTGDWNETVERIVPLPEASRDSFELYLGWTYARKVFALSSKASEYDRLAKAYVLGEMLLDGDFRNAIIDAIISTCQDKDSEGSSWFPTGSTVDIIYNGTSASSPARRLMVDMHVFYGREGWIKSGGLNNTEFLTDLTQKLLEQRPTPSTRSPLMKHSHDRSCDYHISE